MAQANRKTNAKSVLSNYSGNLVARRLDSERINPILEVEDEGS